MAGVKRYHHAFPALLEGFQLETLEKDPQSVFGLSKDLTLNYFNPAWFSFAAENDGEPAISRRFRIGTPIADAITGPLREYYLSAFRMLLATGEVWHQDYECSSPEVYRLFHQAVYPLHNRQGLVIVNALVVEEAHDTSVRAPHPPLEELYTQPTGLLTQCSNCRRFQRAVPPAEWDWVPAWVRQMPLNTSHSICAVCFEYYYASQPPTRQR